MNAAKVTVLVVYKEFPAPSVGHAGGKAVFRVIDALHRRGHHISLVARVRQEEVPLVEQLASLCDRLYTVPHHQALAGPRPLAFLRSYLALRREAARAIQDVRPDLVHVEVTQTAFCLLGLRRPLASFRPLDVNWFLLEQHAAQTQGMRRLLARAAARLLRLIEPWICRHYDLIAAISEGDRRLLAPCCGERPIVILPLSPSFAIQADVQPAVPGEANVLFVGAMYRTYNVQGVQWFLDRVWPSVLSQVPHARFYVVGYNPPPEIRARHDGEHVFVVGFAQDLAPWYRAAAVSISPLRVAGGLLLKIVDALAAGTPVVATPVSNHGVGATAGEHLLLADDPEGFASAVVRLLQDPAERARLAQAGRQFVREQYDLERAIDRWEAMWLAQLQTRFLGKKLASKTGL